MRRGLDDRLGKVERRTGKPPDPDQEHKLRVVDDWLEAVTGKRLDQMSNDELDRLDQLSRSDEIMGDDDPAELVLGCMDENQTVIDLEQRRQMLDRWPGR